MLSFGHKLSVFQIVHRPYPMSSMIIGPCTVNFSHVNQKFRTGLKLSKNFLVTGAFIETNEQVETEICRFVPEHENAVVVEFGMGHGNITQSILNRMHSNSRLYSFEVNADFCVHVKQHLKDERLIIINDSAEQLTKYVQTPINTVISSIPFSFISPKKGAQIIKTAHQQLLNKGHFNQVLLTKFNFKKFQKVFASALLLKIKTVPSYYIYHCQKDLDKTV